MHPRPFPIEEPPKRRGTAAPLAGALALCLAAGLRGQDAAPFPQEDRDGRPLADLSLEELARIPVRVASRTALAAREAPGIVSLITRDEIQESGARDLIDVLRLVPGMEFGQDVRGVTGIGIRGNWAHEGKVLVLWDGQALNEVLYSTVQLGQHYPVDLIERIEVVRGPGSAVHGGNAELGVINIITRPASELHGTMAGLASGWMSKAYGRKGAALAVGERGGDLQFDCSLFAGNGNRSDQVFTDYHPDNPSHSFPMGGQETLENFMLNLGVRYRDFRARVLVDEYHLNDRTMYGTNLPSAPRIDFLSRIVDASWDIRAGDRVRVTPRLNYTQNTPWQCLDARYEPPIYLDKWAERFTASVAVEARVSPSFDLLCGAEHYVDRGHAGPGTYFNRVPTQKLLEYGNSSIYAQGMWRGDLGNLTLGARLERNSKAGSSFVPRVALTRACGNFHWKALYSFAFRSPGIENISRYASTPVKPERTRVAELEGGWTPTPRMSITANLFDITIRDPIVFDIDPVLRVPAYYNRGRTGTSGAEAVYRYKAPFLDASLTYSFYRSNSREVLEYAVNEDPRALLGFARHKFTLSATVHPSPDFSFNTSATQLSRRWADDDLARRQLPQEGVLLLNCFATYRLREGISLGLGAYNLLNARYTFIQPYPGGSAPLPGPSRELLLKVSYQRRF